MPRIALLWLALVGGCFFDASYSGTIRCGDGRCPSGLICHEPSATCVTTIPDDVLPDVPDAPPAALTCADPGLFAATGGTVTGTTTGGTSKMSSTCGGFINNGADRVYRIEMDGTKQLRVSIDEGARKAYVIAACVESPNTPACLGNDRASLGDPIVVTPAAGPAYVVVDDEVAGVGGAGPYRLTLTPITP